MGALLSKLRAAKGRGFEPPPPQPSPAKPAKPGKVLSGSLQAKLDFAKSDKGKHLSMSEINRICGLPVCPELTKDEQEAMNQDLLLADAYDKGFRLFPTQADAIAQFMQFNGLIGPIPVGWGKTLTCFAISAHAYKHLGVERIALFAPPAVMPQLIGHDLAWIRTKIHVPFGVHILHGKPKARRRKIAEARLPGMYIIPYSLLSTTDSSEVLDMIRPQLIVADEAQNIKDRSAARTKRVLAYIEDHKPLGACLSGTITSKSIRDYWHLSRWCLGNNNPLPNTPSMAAEWAAILDAEMGNAPLPESASSGPLAPLVSWANDLDPASKYPKTRTGFRKAYQLRLVTAPGVTAPPENEIATGLVFENRPVEDHKAAPNWQKLDDLMKKVEDEWVTPNGDEIDHAIHKWKWLYELSAGFYNELSWPTAHVYASRKSISINEAEDILHRAKIHHALGQDYHKALRSFLQYHSQPGLDTPFLVGQSMHQHGDRDVPSDLYHAWTDWKDADFEDRPDRDSTAVRVCPYKINQAVEWAKRLPKRAGGIIWVYHQEIGLWAYEELRRAGIEAVHCPAGNQGSERILDKNNASKVVVASLTGHGTGKNLQHFQHQFVLQWPRSETLCEQFVGRTHRNGQQADEIVVVTNDTLEFDRLNRAASINDSLYVQQTTGARRKLIIGTYSPMPRIYPPELLIERGLQPKRLTREQLEAMQERFGEISEES